MRARGSCREVQQQQKARRQWQWAAEEYDVNEINAAAAAAAAAALSSESSIFCELPAEEEVMKEREEEEEEIFRMYEFKVRRCMRGRSHDWTECPFAHPGEKARRRDPRKVHYSCNPCPEFRSKGSCRRGDACDLAHGVFESWLHPARYRTHLCKDAHSCSRRVCFFAHNPLQLRRLHPPSSSPASDNSPDLDAADLAAAESQFSGFLHYLHVHPPTYHRPPDRCVDNLAHDPFRARSSHLDNRFHLSLPPSPKPAYAHCPPSSLDCVTASTNLHPSDADFGRRLHLAAAFVSKSDLSNVHSPSGFGSGSDSSPGHLRRYFQVSTSDCATAAAADLKAETCGGYVSSSYLARCLQKERDSAVGLARYADDHEEPETNHRYMPPSPMPNYLLLGEPSPVTGSLLMHYVSGGAGTISSTFTASKGLDGASSYLTSGLHELDSTCTGANSAADHDLLLQEAVSFISSYDSGPKRQQQQEPSTSTKPIVIVAGSSADLGPADVNRAHFEFAPFPSPTSTLLLGGHTSNHGTGCSPYITPDPSTTLVFSALAASEKLHTYSIPKSPEVANNDNEDNLLQLLLQQQALDVSADSSRTSCKDDVAGIDHHEVIGRHPAPSILIPTFTQSPGRSIGMDSSIIAGDTYALCAPQRRTLAAAAGGGSCSRWERRRRQKLWKGGVGVEGGKRSGKMMGMEGEQEEAGKVGSRTQRWLSMVGNGWDESPDVDLGWVRELVS